MSIKYQEYLGRFVIGNTLKDLTVNGEAISLTTGNYYTYGYDGESDNQLCEELQEKIQTIDGYENSTVIYSNGVITITLDGPADIVFTDNNLAAYLGFSTTSLTDSATYSSDQNPRCVWRPSRGPSFTPVNSTRFWCPRSTSNVLRSANGVTYSIQGNILNDAVIEYQLLEGDEVITPATNVNIYKSFEQFFKDVVHYGQPIRVLPDRDTYTVSSYKTAIFGTDEMEKVSSLGDYIGRYIENYNGLFSISLPLLEFVQ